MEKTIHIVIGLLLLLLVGVTKTLVVSQGVARNAEEKGWETHVSNFRHLNESQVQLFIDQVADEVHHREIKQTSILRR